MSQITGNASAGIGGIFLALGAGGIGQVVHLVGNGDPNTLTDQSIFTAAVGSLFSRLDGGTSTSLYVKTAFVAGASGTWTGK